MRRISFLVVGSIAYMLCAALAIDGCSSGDSGPHGLDATAQDDVRAQDAGLDGAPSPDASPADAAEASAPPDAGSLVDAGAGDGAIAPVDHSQVNAAIGPLGGTLSHPGGASVVVPAGALSDTIWFTLAGVDPPSAVALGAQPVGQGFTLSPGAQKFLSPVTITLPLRSALLPSGTDPAAIHAYQSSGAAPYAALASTADLVQATVTTTTTLGAGALVPALAPSSPSTLSISTTSPLPPANVGAAYTTTFGATGGTSPYAWALASSSVAPPGLALDASGQLAGTPTTSASYGMYVTVTDAAHASVSRPFVLQIGPQLAPVPSITSLFGDHAPAGSATTTSSVMGTGFVPNSTGAWDGSPLATSYVSPTRLTVTLPASLLVNAGTHNVTVTNAPPGGGTSAPVTFTVDAPPPTNPVPQVTGVSPTSLPIGSPDSVVQVMGTGFVPSTVVFEGHQTFTSHFVSATEIDVVIPAALITTDRSVALIPYSPAPGGGYPWNFLSVQVGNGDPDPHISSFYGGLAPAVVSAGSAAFTLSQRVDRPGGVLEVGGSLLPTTQNQSAEIATVPASIVSAPGVLEVDYLEATGYLAYAGALTVTSYAPVSSSATNAFKDFAGGPDMATVSGSDAFWFQSSQLRHCALPACTSTNAIAIGDGGISLGSPVRPIVSGSSLYFLSSGGGNGEIVTCSLPACANTAVLVPSASEYVVDGGHVYWLQRAPGYEQLYACDLPACSTPHLLADRLFGPSLLTVDGSNAYFTDQFGDIKACALPDCAGGLKTLTSALGPGFGIPETLASNGQYLYVGNVHDIYECAVADCGGTLKSIARGYGYPYFIVAHNTLYFGYAALFACSLPGCPGGPRPLLWSSTPAQGTYPIASDSTSLYAWAFGQMVSITLL